MSPVVISFSRITKLQIKQNMYTMKLLRLREINL